MPLRRLLVEHAAAQGTSHSMRSRISASLDFATRLSALDTSYFANHPKLAQRLKRLQDQNPNYIAHEYFNQDLTPFYFMDVAQELSEAKLSWIGPADAVETLDVINLTKDQRQLLAEIDNEALRQTVRDHILDQQFRRDIFIKGPLRLSAIQARSKWLETRFILSRKGSDIPRQVKGLRHTATLQSAVYDPLIASLEQGPRSLREVMNDPALAKMDLKQVVQAITFMAGQGVCYPCLPEQGLSERKFSTDRFNKAVAEQARYEHKFSHFASGETGGGIAVDRINQLIWLALHNKAEDVSRFVWDALSQAGHRLVKDGKPLPTEEENLAELRQRVLQFEQSSLNIWKSAGLDGSFSASESSGKLRLSA
jgi:hypothetical protein